jgi:hypothetical protein
MTVVVAVHITTESGDDYLFCEPHDEIVATIHDCLSSELAYVSSVTIDSFPQDLEVQSLVRHQLAHLSDNYEEQL